MSERISGPIGRLALITALLMSGVSVGLRANTARANAPLEDCLDAPKSPAPQGRHWYYRIDRAKLRKCWYLGALDQPVHHPVAQTVSRAAAGAQPIALEKPAPVSPGAPASITSDNGTPLLPHIKMLVVKSQPAPVSSGMTDQLTQQSSQEEDFEPSFPEMPAAQSGAGAQAAEVGPAAAPLRPQGPIAVPNEPRPASLRPISYPGDAESTARSGTSTNAAAIVASLTSVEIFPVLALCLATAGIAFRIVMKIVTAHRNRIVIDRREFDWIGDRHQYVCGDQPQHRCGAEFGEFIDDVRRPVNLASDCSETSLPQADDGWLDKDNNVQANDFQSKNEISDCEDMLGQLRRDLEKLLRSRKVA
jgi:hypothetical protein